MPLSQALATRPGRRLERGFVVVIVVVYSFPAASPRRSRPPAACDRSCPCALCSAIKKKFDPLLFLASLLLKPVPIPQPPQPATSPQQAAQAQLRRNESRPCLAAAPLEDSIRIYRYHPLSQRSSLGSHRPLPQQAHCDRLIAASIKYVAPRCALLLCKFFVFVSHNRFILFRSSEPDIEQPRSSHHLVDDAEKHADVKVVEPQLRAALPHPPPRRRTSLLQPWVSRSRAAASIKTIDAIGCILFIIILFA